MVIGFVLVNTAVGKDREVYDALLGVSEVTELYILFGEYDVLAKIETDSVEKLSHIVINRIRSLDGVIETKTLTGAS